MTILHVQKVSGISGSEAHLLSLLPLLRARGWDARMLVLHEGEPGAAAFMEAMAAKRCPSRSCAFVSTSIPSRSCGSLPA